MSTLSTSAPSYIYARLRGTLISGGVTSFKEIPFIIRYISSKVSNLTTPSISDIEYTVTDPRLMVTFPPFINSDPTLHVIYSLLNSDGNPIDADIFSFNSSTLNFTV
jgi:hypothetical protein